MNFTTLYKRIMNESSITLQQLLDSADLSDEYEEDAEDFLHSKKIPLTSHSRTNTLKLAWKHGWRPSEE